jgi:hypothetical protein
VKQRALQVRCFPAPGGGRMSCTGPTECVTGPPSAGLVRIPVLRGKNPGGWLRPKDASERCTSSCVRAQGTQVRLLRRLPRCLWPLCREPPRVSSFCRRRSSPFRENSSAPAYRRPSLRSFHHPLRSWGCRFRVREACRIRNLSFSRLRALRGARTDCGARQGAASSQLQSSRERWGGEGACTRTVSGDRRRSRRRRA